MKGRRHRLQYKKKVDPDLIVDIKPSSRQKKLDERLARNRRGFHEGSVTLQFIVGLFSPKSLKSCLVFILFFLDMEE